MTFQPFSSAYVGALTQQTVPDMSRTFEQGRKVREQDRLLAAQAEAGRLLQSGDSEGANRLLLASGAASGGDWLQYQAQNAAISQRAHEAAIDNARQDAAAKEQRWYHEQSLIPENRRNYMIDMAQGRIPRSMSLSDYVKQMDPDYVDPQRLIDAVGGGGAPAGQGASSGRPGMQPAPGPRNDEYVAPAPPPAQPPIISPQTGNLDTGLGDVPLNPGQGAFGQGAPVPPAQGVAAAVQPPQGAPVAPPGPPPVRAPVAPPTAPAAAPGAQTAAHPFTPEQEGKFWIAMKAGRTKEALDTLLKQDRPEGVGREFQQTNELRTQWLNQSKDFITRRIAYQNLLSAARDHREHPNDQGASSIALIFAYMKMLDPTSVVRENEQASAQNAGGIDPAIRNMYNSLLKGNKVPPEVRDQMVRQAGYQYRGHFQAYQTQRETFSNIARGSPGIRPELAIPDVSAGIGPPSDAELLADAAGGGDGGYRLRPGQDRFSQQAEQQAGERARGGVLPPPQRPPDFATGQPSEADRIGNWLLEKLHGMMPGR